MQTASATPILVVEFDRSYVQNIAEHCQDAWELLDGRAKPILSDLDDEDLLTPYYRSLAHVQLALLGLRLMRTQGMRRQISPQWVCRWVCDLTHLTHLGAGLKLTLKIKECLAVALESAGSALDELPVDTDQVPFLLPYIACVVNEVRSDEPRHVWVQAKLVYGLQLRLGEALHELRKYLSDHVTPPAASLFAYLRKSSDGTEVIKQLALAMRMLSRCASQGSELDANVRTNHRVYLLVSLFLSFLAPDRSVIFFLPTIGRCAGNAAGRHHHQEF